jgi:glutathione S-transferase
MLKVYGHATSINVRKVLWTCEELGEPFQREDKGGDRHPVGLVPVIEDGACVIWESNVIVRYLATTRGRADLAPMDPVARAHVEQWMDFQASDFNNSWRVAFQALVRKNPAFQDEAAVSASIAQWNHMVGIIDRQLAKTGAFIAAENFTMADIVIGLSLHRWRAAPLEHPDFPHVARYYARLLTRPGFIRYGRDGGP